ncbi:hypothetical protein IMPR6_490013 [Imperialibacter sp. EC-SDR9]|nr:hypothetical protein IMPR6_490013 [Imperialibacter sp. EC-SDR9]
MFWALVSAIGPKPTPYATGHNYYKSLTAVSVHCLAKTYFVANIGFKYGQQRSWNH